jgi:hypothetical protein
LIRSAAFFLFASAYWALLPLVARVQIARGSDLYGFLLGVIGAAAVAAALALPWLKSKLGADRLVAVRTTQPTSRRAKARSGASTAARHRVARNRPALRKELHTPDVPSLRKPRANTPARRRPPAEGGTRTRDHHNERDRAEPMPEPVPGRADAEAGDRAGPGAWTDTDHPAAAQTAVDPRSEENPLHLVDSGEVGRGGSRASTYCCRFSTCAG